MPYGSKAVPAGAGDVSAKADKVGSSDIEITASSKGLILRSDDGTTRVRVGIALDPASGQQILKTETVA